MAGAKIVLIASLGLLVAGGARAQQAAAPSARCAGTLCDLYYGAKGEPAQATTKPASAPAVAGVPAGATPLMAPSAGSLLSGNPIGRLFGGGSSSDGTRPPPPPDSEPASASNSYMHLGTGGLLGHSDRCSGTLCDTYYGSSPAEPAAADAQQTAQQAATPAAATERPVAYRHIPHESETRPTCSSPANDPWRCFRK